MTKRKNNFTTGLTLFLPMQIGAFSRQTKKKYSKGVAEGVTLEKQQQKKNKAPSHGNRPATCI